MRALSTDLQRRWVEVTETNVVRALVVLAAWLLVAWLAGRLLARWARRVGDRRGARFGDDMARATRGHVPLFIALLGVYTATTVLDVGDRALVVVGGLTYVIAALVALRLALRGAQALLRSYFEHHALGADRARAEKEYLPLATLAATIALCLVAIITVAHHFGHDVSSLVTALGVGSLAIGLAAQQTLGNMIAGFTILVDRPFRPGDRIRLATGESGEVHDIGVRSTRILLSDGNLLIVPNTELANSRVVNFAYPMPGGRGEIRFTVPRDTNLDALEKALVASARRDDAVLADPAPALRVVTLGRADVEIALEFQVSDQAGQRAVEDRLRREVIALVPR